MRLPDDRKRQQILTAAARLFATQAFHKVRLEDVAAKAKVGKGTLYIYFSGKEDLYYSIIYEGFADLVLRLREQLADESLGAWRRLERIVGGVVAFVFQHPHLAELMRTAAPPRDSGQWQSKYREFAELITRCIERGVASGELSDPHPELTALFIPGMVRAAMIHGPKGIGQTVITEHILQLLRQGMERRRNG